MASVFDAGIDASGYAAVVCGTWQRSLAQLYLCGLSLCGLDCVDSAALTHCHCVCLVTEVVACPTWAANLDNLSAHTHTHTHTHTHKHTHTYIHPHTH